MVRIYTKKGDDGTTSLWYGGRRPKHHVRIESYGSVDEAGSALGYARSLCGPDDAELAGDILRVQRDLFVAGGELANDPEGLASEAVLRYLNRASDLVYAMARFADIEDPEIFEGRDAGGDR